MCAIFYIWKSKPLHICSLIYIYIHTYSNVRYFLRRKNGFMGKYFRILLVSGLLVGLLRHTCKLLLLRLFDVLQSQEWWMFTCFAVEMFCLGGYS